MLPTIFLKPTYRTNIQGLNIELWVSQRKLPYFSKSDALIVPVAPDLKMVFGIAKIARDYGANTIQYEANDAAPLAPGQAFIGAGARYRYKYTALAVIFDEFKRTNPPLMAEAIRTAMLQARRKGAESVVIPDMTENLLAQPNWITDEQRRSTAEVVARLTMDAIAVSRGTLSTVRIWVWDPRNKDAFLGELHKLEQEGLAARAQGVLPEAEIAAEDAAMERPDWVEYGDTATIRDTKITAVFGDALRLEGDAITRATSTTLDLETPQEEMAKTLSTRILQRGGPKLVEELRSLGALSPGDAALTHAGAWENVKVILHLVVRTSDFPAREDAIASSLRGALELADENEMRVLIIPNPGAGPNEYPPELALSEVLEVISEYLNTVDRNSGIEQIFLVGEDWEAEAALRRALARFLPAPIAIPLPTLGGEH
jgi:O-acetyl-ADP-ribose deacetylase (regulator of RNase III)